MDPIGLIFIILNSFCHVFIGVTSRRSSVEISEVSIKRSSVPTRFWRLDAFLRHLVGREIMEIGTKKFNIRESRHGGDSRDNNFGGDW